MEDFDNAKKALIWKPATGSPWSDAIWAPELHHLNDTWYVYAASAQPGAGNAGHRTILLRSRNRDPMDATAWQFLGPLRGLPDHWHIDATVFSPRPGELFCCYSGWPLGDHSDTQQDLFLVRMANPEQAIAESLIVISRAELPWERPEGGRRGVNEGPTWVSIPGWKGIVYSANGSWTCDYQLGVLRLVEQDASQTSSWRKRHSPLLKSDARHGGPFGPGHASFVPSPHDDGRVYCVYHGTERQDEGWANRKARIMVMNAQCFELESGSLCCALPMTMSASSSAAQSGQAAKAQQSDLEMRARSGFKKLKGELIKRLT